MPENVFEKIEHLSEQQEQAARQAAQDKQDILNAIANLNDKRTSTFQPQIAQANEKLTLQNFVKLASKEYHFFGDADSFVESKKKTLLALVVALCIGIIVNGLTAKGCGVFSTFTLIEDLWLFLVIRMICHTVHSKRFYDHVDYSLHSHQKFKLNADSLYCPVKTKASYNVIKIIAVISSICNIICLYVRKNGAITVWAIIFELLFIVSIFITMYMMTGHFCMYSLVYYTGKNDVGTQALTIVHDMIGNRLYEKEKYENSFPFAK